MVEFRQLQIKNNSDINVYPYIQKDFAIAPSMNYTKGSGETAINYTWQAPTGSDTEYKLKKGDAVVTSLADIEDYIGGVLHTTCLPTANLPTYVLAIDTGKFCKLAYQKNEGTPPTYSLVYTIEDIPLAPVAAEPEPEQPEPPAEE